MGLTGLARWINAPPQGLGLVRDNMMLNHNATYRGKWNISIRSYRSTINQLPIPTLHGKPDRLMCSLTMDDNVFVLIENPDAPMRADVLAAAPPGDESTYIQGCTHFRTTFLTLRPPGALEQLLAQLKARWLSVRQTTTAQSRGSHTSGQQILIDGQVFAIGTDWIVRIGNVVLAGGAVKGMLLEAEYLPLPLLRSSNVDGTSELLSNLLTSILPNIPDAKTVAVTMSETQWEDSMYAREDPVQKSEDMMSDDIYAIGHEDIPESKRGDWLGLDRERRSAFVILGALRSEGLL
ncbi:hypothetical protein AGABI2DRAFT_192060 [Agaricus bisporus var. bisporus H97]|uniref:hypothetical protein n=1 Tax=Agaricus bisporus var. bisporus (strain H97 / ATCC MYA-4626 / FGSC 10389) TaxID=936046 RepID=UPI00029F750E|nr:hypothetical protein AGABI2DRAFT_192060 [Agaricus bisporus var. bisporus H97]EKV48453.1 hypothetical protein AGABI2DRAFT_192060 [Agaricus bisporus var. bisporus H97]